MKTMKATTIKSRANRRCWSRLAIGVLSVVFAAAALAQGEGSSGGIPELTIPGGAGGDDPLGAFWGSGQFLLKVLIILLGGATFAAWVAAVIRKFMDVNDRNGSLGEVIPVAGIGLVILVLAAAMLILGWNIVNDTTLSTGGGTTGGT